MYLESNGNFQKSGNIVRDRVTPSRNLQAVRKINALIESFINAGASFGINELLSDVNKVFNENITVLNDKVLKQELQQTFLKLLINDIENNYSANSSVIFKFMQKKLGANNAYFKREPACSQVLDAVRSGIKICFLGDGCACGANSIMDFVQQDLAFKPDKVFPNPDIKETYNALAMNAIKTALGYGCTEEAIDVILFMEKYLNYDRNNLKTFFNKLSLKKVICLGYMEGLKENVPGVYEDMVHFAKEYLSFSERKIEKILKKVQKNFEA